MSSTQTVLKKLPGVLSLTRRLNVTDALFYSLHEDGTEKKLAVKRGGLRGTQNINKKNDEKRPEVSNIQLTDTAKSDSQAVAVVVKTSISFLPLNQGLHSCALGKKDEDELLDIFKESLSSFLDRTAGNGVISSGLQEVANRYARNIANGGWLWRNRQFSAAVAIEVTCGNDTFKFDALKIPLNRFDNYSADEIKVGQYIASSLAGNGIHSLQIKATLDFGKGMNANIEVYPSQNYLGGDKPKGFARSLYAVDTEILGYSKGEKEASMEYDAIRVIGHAALRDTKIANALRTFDTWYAEFESHGHAIAVEPNGANLSAQRMFRNGDSSSFAYARRLNTITPDSNEGMFMIAALIRGGVYSEGGDA
jgi:CRISPR-associated protein Csy3